jgi:hypothetical protein
MDDLFAFRRVHFIDLLDQSQRIVFLQGGLLRVDFFGGLDLGVRKKLLPPSAGLSPRPVVAPVDS